tara:strand:- start:2035 stop:2904 length:870 start_codon:yes stop_codon:yes gene_type:complete
MYAHEPVLLAESLDNLVYDKKGVYLDCTFGLGGHSKGILDYLATEGRLYSVDKDPNVLSYAEKISDSRFEFIKSDFGNISSIFKNQKFNGILFDLGISSMQIDDPDRGFSFSKEGILDMRLDNSHGLTAKEWINSASEKQLADTFYNLGEERKSRIYAKRIVSFRKLKPLETTKELAEITRPRGYEKRHPATNIFRALRIFINNELEELKCGLKASVKLLKDKGRLAVISFHSSEDRIVKNFIKESSQYNSDEAEIKLISKLKPSKEEILKNPRSRSAILRVGEVNYVS